MEELKELIKNSIDDPAFAEWLCDHIDSFKFVVYQGMDAMDKDVEALDLSLRSQNCLKRGGYDTINSFVEHIDSRQDFSKIRNVGRKSTNEIMVKLFLYTYRNLPPAKRKAYIQKVQGLN